MDEQTFRDFVERGIPYNRMLGLRVGELREGYVRLDLPWRDDFVGDPSRPAMHGGVISSLADTAGGMAVWFALRSESARVSTIDLRVDYLRPGAAEALYAEASVLRVGNRVGVADVRLYHPAHPEQTIATAKGVYAIRPARADDEEPERVGS